MSRRDWRKKWAPYKSGLEASVAASLKENGIEFRYEPETLKYRKRVVKGVCDACGGDKTSQRCTYRPDFVLRRGDKGDRWYIEVKGHFSPADRAKMVAVKQDNPELDIRLIFGANNKLRKNNDKRYSEWAVEHGFKYWIGKSVPADWVREVGGTIQTPGRNEGSEVRSDDRFVRRRRAKRRS